MKKDDNPTGLACFAALSHGWTIGCNSNIKRPSTPHARSFHRIARNWEQGSVHRHWQQQGLSLDLHDNAPPGRWDVDRHQIEKEWAIHDVHKKMNIIEHGRSRNKESNGRKCCRILAQDSTSKTSPNVTPGASAGPWHWLESSQEQSCHPLEVLAQPKRQSQAGCKKKRWVCRVSWDILGVLWNATFQLEKDEMVLFFYQKHLLQ